jgi:hypothetical protein
MARIRRDNLSIPNGPEMDEPATGSNRILAEYLVKYSKTFEWLVAARNKVDAPAVCINFYHFLTLF